MILTTELIQAGASKAGGWTKAQLALLGIPWEGSKGPKSGWMQKVIGTEISKKTYADFIELTGKTKRVSRRAKKKTPTPLPFTSDTPDLLRRKLISLNSSIDSITPKKSASIIDALTLITRKANQKASLHKDAIEPQF